MTNLLRRSQSTLIYGFGRRSIEGSVSYSTYNIMNVALIIIVVVVVIAAIVYFSKLAAERNRARLAALAGWANANGFQFTQGDPFNLDSRFNGLANIGKGHARYACEVFARQTPVPTWLFRYHYKTWETRTVTRNGRTYTEQYEATHWQSYLFIELQAAFPMLFIRPESFLDKVAGFVGFDDIDFESEAFSKQFFVKSESREFAYAIIHPQVMEFLLTRPQFQGQFDRGVFMADIGKRGFTVEGVAAALSDAVGLINRIPPFVWQDYGKTNPIVLPEPIRYELSPAVPN